MSFRRVKELHEEVVKVAGGSPAAWDAFKHKVQHDPQLMSEERELIQEVIRRLEDHPEDLPALKVLFKRLFR